MGHNQPTDKKSKRRFERRNLEVAQATDGMTRGTSTRISRAQTHQKSSKISGVFILDFKSL